MALSSQRTYLSQFWDFRKLPVQIVDGCIQKFRDYALDTDDLDACVNVHGRSCRC